MPRPRVPRCVEEEPPAKAFKPAGIPAIALERVILELDEFEALRLADLEGLYQEDAAQLMGVSRQTFGRILESARHKVAEALVEGKMLIMKGGSAMGEVKRVFQCSDCGHEWEVPFGTPRPGRCPECGGVNLHRAGAPGWCRGHGGRFRRRWRWRGGGHGWHHGGGGWRHGHGHGGA